MMDELLALRPMSSVYAESAADDLEEEKILPLLCMMRCLPEHSHTWSRGRLKRQILTRDASIPTATYHREYE